MLWRQGAWRYFTGFVRGEEGAWWGNERLKVIRLIITRFASKVLDAKGKLDRRMLVTNDTSA